MKKIGIILCTAALAVQAAAISASAEEASAKVYVTIGNAGKTVVAAEAVTVKDLDSDGKLTIDEALYAAHEQFYNGGAAAGYANETTQYGLSLKTLWGVTNGGGYGYYVNDGFAMSLSDPVKEGDYLNAFVYQDLDKWSDRYAYFDVRTLPDAKQGDTVTLKLSEMVFGADGAPVPGPVANAVITVDGEETAYKTDADGKVDLKLEKAGSVQISAKADHILAPFVLRAEVGAAETTAAPETTTVAAETTTAAATTTTAKAGSTTTTKAAATKTGDTNAVPALAVTMLAGFGAALAMRRRTEK